MATQASEVDPSTGPEADEKPSWMKARVSIHRRAEQDTINAEVLDRARVDFDDH